MTFNDLITEVNATLTAHATEVGDDIVGINSTGDAKFNHPGGTWGDDPNVPLTTANINLSLTGALNAGTTCIYYKGNVLGKSNFTGGTVVFLNGVNVLNELCAVWIIYDKNSGAFHVNITKGYTGDLPPSTVPDAPTVLTLTEGVISTTPDAPTALTLTEGTI